MSYFVCLNEKINCLNRFVLLFYFLLSTSISASELNTFNEDITTVISNPLVLITGASRYDTMPDLPSVHDELEKLHTLFRDVYGYDVESTYFNKDRCVVIDKINVLDEKGIEMKFNDGDKNFIRGRLSKERLDDFIHEKYNVLYNKKEFYDGLIFIFSGHGYGDKNGNEMIATSDFFVTNGEPNNYKYLSEIRSRFSNFSNENFKKHFAHKPKIFFFLACRSSDSQKITYERKNQYGKGDPENEYEAENVLTYYTTTSGRITQLEKGWEFIKIFSETMEESLNKKSRSNSLSAIMSHVSSRMKKIGACLDVGGPLALHTNNIYFSLAENSNVKTRLVVKAQKTGFYVLI